MNIISSSERNMMIDVYFYRIAVFSIKVLRDERVVVIAEQRPEASEEEVTYLLLQKAKHSFDYCRCS